VAISFADRVFRLEKSDIIGICEIGSDEYNHTYTAATDVTVFAYPYKNLSSLDTMLQNNADSANLLVNAMCRQISVFLHFKIKLKQDSERLYESIEDIHPKYGQLCAQYAFAPKQPPDISTIAPFTELDPIDEWLNNYYMEIRGMDPAVRKGFFQNKPGITVGFIRKSVEDAYQALQSCLEYHEYIKTVVKVLLNNTGHDLFTLISEVHLNSVNIKGADAVMEGVMGQITGVLSDIAGIDAAYYRNRLQIYNDSLASKRANQSITEDVTSAGPAQNLSDSMQNILEYSGCANDICNNFMRLVQEFKNTGDKGGSDDDTRRLRREIAKVFYDIYTNVFIKSLTDPAVPTVIKMFLNFGYVDAALAGQENANYLYSIADSLRGDPEMGVYTICEWLTAIYHGLKEPCRNDFDEDYPAYIREMRQTQKITAQEEAQLLKDLMGKLRFELENVFPIANKITFGIISTFCPIFSEHNVQRKPETSLVRPALLKEHFDMIRSIDYSAYFRETLYQDPAHDNIKEYISVEVMPDIILMPNVGIRGSMWQEIEGRVRTTPARMFLPIFFQNDLRALVIRLTGEFRWEMCKRIQGARWNDLSDPSLTSEYCDYLQFYKSNKDLSMTVKEQVKAEILRAKNNYKNVFTTNYNDWILHEANGSQRLNKHARRMMITYCPFPEAIREKLAMNPGFSDLVSKHHLKQNKRISYLSRVIKKIETEGQKVPKVLHDELAFAGR
jgi:hypothetical protein